MRADSPVTRLLGVESLSIAANPLGNVVLLRAPAAEDSVDGLEVMFNAARWALAANFNAINIVLLFECRWSMRS